MKSLSIAMIVLGCMLLAYSVLSRLSPDAIGMAIGMTLGVIAGVPTAALVLLARRRDAEDDWQPTIINYPLPPAQPAQPVQQINTYQEDAPVFFKEDVTPYYRVGRRLLGMPDLPSRADLDAYLADVEAKRDQRQFRVVWNQEDGTR